MPRIVPVVFLILLAGCGYHGCMSQADIYNDEIRGVIHANPAKDSSGNVQAWTKVDFPVEGKRIKLKVEHSGLNFCNKSEINGKILDVPDSAPLSNANMKKQVVFRYPDKISQGETLTFMLDPIKQFTIDETICRNQNEDIRVTDVDNCLSSYIGQKHSVYFSNKLAAATGGFTNSWYIKTKSGDVPFIVDDVVPVLFRTGASDMDSFGMPRVSTNAATTTPLSSKRGQLNNGLCWNREEVLGEANKMSVNSGDKKKQDAELAKVRSRVRELRGELNNILDEHSINVLCGKLCSADGVHSGLMRLASQVGGLSSSCQGVHLVTRKDKGNEIPFVVLEGVGSIFQHNAQSKDKLGIPGSIDDSADIPGKMKTDLSNARDKMREVKDYSSMITGSIKNYLMLGTPYEYKSSGASNTNSYTDVTLSIDLAGESEIFHLTGGRNIVGRYSISIKKDCSAHVRKSLYYKFSESPLRGSEGFDDAKQISFLVNNITEIDASGQKGDLYIGVKDNGDGYDNNVGYYELRYSISKTPPKVFSHITTWTEDKVRGALYGRNNDDSVVRNLYEHISKSGPFTRMVNALLILYVLVSALYFVLGFSKASIYQLVITVFKIVAVMFVLRPDSWTFFNDHLLNLFINAPKFLIDAMTGSAGGDFGFMDNVLYRFSISQTWIQLLALIFAGPIGWLTTVLIFWGIVVLVQFLFQAIVIYLISIMAIALLLCIAPYFLICVLFRRTKNIFDMWIKTLLQTAMQPVVIFTCIALLITAINDVIYAMLNFEVCDACVFKADLKVTTVCLLSFPLPIGVIPTVPIGDAIRELYNTGETVILGLPGPLANVLIFLALVHAARDFVLNSGDMCSIMFGVFTNLSEVGSTAAQSLLGVVGMDRATGQTLEHHRRQSALFNRGPGAGRDESSLMGPMRGSSGVSGGVDRERRQVIIHPGDPPASF